MPLADLADTAPSANGALLLSWC